MALSVKPPNKLKQSVTAPNTQPLSVKPPNILHLAHRSECAHPFVFLMGWYASRLQCHLLTRCCIVPESRVLMK